MIKCVECSEDIEITRENSTPIKKGYMIVCVCKAGYYVSIKNNPELEQKINYLDSPAEVSKIE